MRTNAIALLLVGACAGMPAFLGCDKTVSEKETVKTKSDGTSMKKTDTVTEKADGTMVTESKKTVDNNKDTVHDSNGVKGTVEVK